MLILILMCIGFSEIGKDEYMKGGYEIQTKSGWSKFLDGTKPGTESAKLGLKQECATQGFNQILVARAAKHNLTYIDTYPASRDLMELSFDGAHYADPVSKAVAVQVERWLEEVLLAPR